MSAQEIDDYSAFDAEGYQATMFGSIQGPKGQQRMRVFVLDVLSDIYNTGIPNGYSHAEVKWDDVTYMCAHSGSIMIGLCDIKTPIGMQFPGKIRGDTLLDFGTGPVVYNIVSAARHFSNIYFSDYSPTNREALDHWLTKDNQALDLSHFFKHVSERNNSQENWSDLERDLKKRVKGILFCDMMLDNPLYPCIFPQFDCVSSGLCLEVAQGGTTDAYKQAAKNMVSLVKPGGWVVMNGVLSCNFYKFGQSKYHAVCQTADEIKRVFTDMGFSMDVWKEYNMTEDEKSVNTNSDAHGMFCMAAQKPA